MFLFFRRRGQKQLAQFFRLAQHGIMTSVEFMPTGAQSLGAPALMGFTWIGGSAAINYGGIPVLRPEVVEFYWLCMNSDRMQGAALNGPST